jgi:hypothetical protein
MSSNEIEPLIGSCRQMLQEGKTVEDILKYLRAETGDKVTSGMVVADLLNLSMGQAKLLVHRSEAWDDVRERDEKLHETFISEFEKINKKK